MLHDVHSFHSVHYSMLLTVQTAQQTLDLFHITMISIVCQTGNCSKLGFKNYWSAILSCSLRAFSVLGPRLWNSLPRLLCDTSHNTTSFGHSLKTFFSHSTSALNALETLTIMCNTNLRFTYLLTMLRWRWCYTRQNMT